MNITYLSLTESSEPRYTITLPSYIDNVSNIYYDYIVVKPTGTDCFILADRSNNFRFYHTTETNIHEAIPFFSITVKDIKIHTPILFHATLIRRNRCAIHDMIYPTNHIPDLTNEQRLNQLHRWFECHPEAYKNDNMIFAISHIIPKTKNIQSEISNVPYPIQYIEYKINTEVSVSSPTHYITSDLLNIRPSDDSVYNIFTIYADIPPDIYRLYTSMNEYVGIAHIPDLSTSIFMNSIFRNIKENTNLDLLEESDDEEEFENTSIDKFVDLQKNVRMKCIYNSVFNKWLPIQIYL